MILHSITSGTQGIMVIRDYTDDPNDMTVDLLVNMEAPAIPIAQFPWAYSVDGENTGWRSVNFMGGGLQRLIKTYVGPTKETLTFHVGNTNTEEFGGPTDLQINLYGYNLSAERLVDIKVGAEWQKALPYVRHNGEWKIAQPFVKTPTEWKPIV